MPYIYNDEDNYPMNDPFNGYHNSTIYSSLDEMKYFDSGRYEIDLEARETAREVKESMIKEGFLDDLGLSRESDCRKCPWLIEGVYEQFSADEDLNMPACCYEIAEGLCRVCKDTNHDDNAIEKYLEEEQS